MAEEWRWTLNWSEIWPDIVVGSCPMTVADLDRIRAETEATAILSVQSNECRAAFDIDYAHHSEHGAAAGLVLINAPMRDFDPPDQRWHLPDAVFELTRLLRQGHKVYVHCTAGINRGPLTVLGYLTFVEGQPVDEALALIKAKRPQAEPTWEAYHDCRGDLVERLKAEIESRAWWLSTRDAESEPERNWALAEAEVIREDFLSKLTPRRNRRDPHRL